MKTFKWAAVGDLQIPYHDPRAVELFMKVMKSWKPDAIDVVGDISDFLEFSSFSDGTTDEFFNKWKNNQKINAKLRELEEKGSEVNPKDYSELIDPLPFIKDSAAGAEAFYSSLRKQHRNADIHASLGNHECFSMDHRVITPEGYKNWNELSVGDYVLSCNDDGSRLWQPVEKIHLYPNDRSYLYKFRYRNVRGEFTGNHRFITRSNYESGKFREHTTDEFVKTCGGVFQTAARGTDLEASVSDDEIRLLAWCLTDSSIYGKGWCFHQSEPKHDRILSLLDRLEIDYRDVARQRTTNEICGKQLKSKPKVSHDIYVKTPLIWEHESHRRLPSIAWSFSERQVRVLVDELQFTDGTQATGGKRCRVIYCSDRAKRDDIRILLVMNGMTTTEKEYSPGYWRINITDQTMSKVDIRRRAVSRVASRGVWCVTVPNGRFFVEADGATHLTGNSRVWKYVDKKAPELISKITPELLWNLDSHGITWRTYEQPPLERFAGLHVHHGATTTSTGLAVKNDIEQYNISMVRGHDHRGGVVYKSYPLSNNLLVGLGTGHLCDTSAYGLQYTINHAWEMGFGIIHVFEGKASPQFIPIRETDQGLTCVVDGKVFVN